MSFTDLLIISISSLWQRKFRTLLTVLGVVIGTMSVVVMLSIGMGMSQAQVEMVESNGSLRQVTVYSASSTGQDSGSGEDKRLDENFLKELTELPGASEVWPVYSVGMNARVAGKESYVYVDAIPAAGLRAMNLELASGSLPSDKGSLSFLAGPDFEEMGVYDLETGEPVPIDFSKDQFFVSFESDGEQGSGEGADSSAESGDANNTSATPAKRVLVPISGIIKGEPGGMTPESTMLYADLTALIKTMKKAMPGKALPDQPTDSQGRPKKVPFVYSRIVLEAKTIEDAEALTKTMNELGYDFESPIEWMNQVKQQSLWIQAIFGGIGLISFLVAAIGIANTMMMSVYERTKAIGIMKVLGAALADIRRMFLIESAAIGFIGGGAGALLSLGVSAVLNALLGEQAVEMTSGSGQLSLIPIWLIPITIGFATLIGAVAGFLPAQRAMQLSPLAAIRNE